MSDTRARVTLSGASRNVLVQLSPEIRWNLTLDIETAGNTPRVFVKGSRTQFPAYEIYIDSHPVYRFAPDNLTANQLPVLRFGLLEALALLDYRRIQPVQTSLP